MCARIRILSSPESNKQEPAVHLHLCSDGFRNTGISLVVGIEVIVVSPAERPIKPHALDGAEIIQQLENLIPRTTTKRNT